MFTIERIEDGIAVLEDDDGDRISVPASLLPKEAKDGDMLMTENGLYVILDEETAARREEMNEFQYELWERF